MPNDPPLDPDSQDIDILITDEYITEDDSKYAVGPDEIGFIPSFLKDKATPLSLWA